MTTVSILYTSTYDRSQRLCESDLSPHRPLSDIDINFVLEKLYYLEDKVVLVLTMK